MKAQTAQDKIAKTIPITRTKKSPDEARVAIPFEIATTTTINIAGSNAVLSASTSS